MNRGWLILVYQCLLNAILTEQKSLDSYIRHYEEVHYDTDDLHQSHLRLKRSTGDTTLRFKFNAFDRDFNIALEPGHSSVFTDKPELDKYGPVETSHIYKGRVEGSDGSTVFGYIIDGHFRGSIRIPTETTYHVEPVRRFLGQVKELPKSHSIIYKEEHIDLDPHRLRREAEKSEGSCGNDKHHDWMQKIAESPYNTRFRRSHYEEETLYHNKYSEALNRKKRSFGFLGGRNTCFLRMQADPELFEKVKSRYGGSEVQAKDDIIGTFATHVDAINNIYTNTRFQTYHDEMYYTGVAFKIQRTTIMTRQTENCGTSSATDFCDSNVDVSNFLNLNSKQDHSEFCLAYIFTYRDFTQGTLGLAWVGSSGQASGGICEKYKAFPEGGRQVWKSLNTGIVTLVNYGDDVAPRVSQLTFAHEVGHNFGSPHDSGILCAPYNTGAPDANQGNYIMYASATKGNQYHNDLFSPCSKDNMTRVMQAVFDGLYGKVNCFKGSDAAFCGNSIVEKGEECDCGYKADCTDQCCIGRQSDGSGCKRASTAVCSPSEGKCCDPKTCKPHTASDNIVCRVETECSSKSYCNGNNASCPPSTRQADYTTFCNDYTKVCVEGMCTGSLCSNVAYTDGPVPNTVKWVECFVKSSGDTVADKEKQCLLGCKPNNTDICYSSDGTDAPDPYMKLLTAVKSKTNNRNVELAAGSPCNDFQGYCDVFKRCRGVDAEGPLSRLKNLLFSEKTFTSIREWIQSHWWAVILITLGLIVFMGLFIKVCAVHTPSSNPKAPPAQHWGDTLRRRRSHPRRPPQQQQRGYSQEPLRQSSPMGPPPPYSASSSSGGKPHPKHGKGQRGKGQGKKGKKDARV